MSEDHTDPLDYMSPELWAVELHYMTGAAFGDLSRAVTGIDHNGQLFDPTPKYIADAFGLLASGMELERADFAENEAAFLAALQAPAEQRAALLQAALDGLSEKLGFTPGPPVVIETFKLRGAN